MNWLKRIGRVPRNQNIIAAVFCAVCVALNLLLSAAATALQMPFHLDTFGTIIAAVTGGYLPGTVVGFYTNSISGISDPSALYFGALNALIAICATWLSRRGWFRKIGGIIGSIVVFALIGGGLGSVISWYMGGLSPAAESLRGILHESAHIHLAAAHVLSSLIVDLPDKAITVLLAASVIRLIPRWFYSCCGFNMWLQNPASAGGGDAADKGRTHSRVLSLRAKVLLMLGVSLTTVAVVAAVISMNVYHKNTINTHMNLAQGAAKVAARLVDGDSVSDYLEDGQDAEGYRETKDMLKELLLSSTDIAFIYVYRVEDDGCRVVFDIDTDTVAADRTGDVIAFDAGIRARISSLLEGKEVEPILTNDEYGPLLTAYQPVRDSKGNTVCYAAADVDLERVQDDERRFLMEMITVFMGFFFLLCAVVMWITDYHIIYPVRALTVNADMIANTGDSQEKLDENVKAFRSIDVHTGDELEILFDSFCKMTVNQTEQVRNIRRLSESTARMQDGLIVTMADMVENRDSDTGAHIQKTAAYVRIIVEGLKRKGYYAEKITPKFMSDVVRSAPLHDVGKINIPDEVLNKPGKLTDEEYAIMKTHAAAGKKIMEHAISTVEGDNYLKEARNMAAYHHERWDGRGYPEGLHGEVIPLSARIMSVADVFDALTSPRVYKPAFPFEKALAIIEEGKGTQFDPKCVEVFMDSLDEVKVVLKKYNQEL